MSRFFKGVSLEQDRRFTNKDQKLAKKVNFPTELDQVIDIKNKVKFEVLRPWITRTTIELLGLEDDVFITYVIELLQKNEEARPRELHVSVTPFLGLENASKFCEELWKLLISAQQSEFGIPSQFLEARKAQLAQQQAIALARQRELDALRNKVTVELAARQAQRLQQEHTTAPSVAPHQPQQAQPKQARPPGPPHARVQVSSADVGAAPAVAPSSRGSDAASLPNMASLIASTQVASSGWDAPTGVIMRADREERRKRRREQQEQRRRGHDGDQEDCRRRSRERDAERSSHRPSGSDRRHNHGRSHRRHRSRSRSPHRRRHQHRSRSSSRSPSRHRRRHRSRSRSRHEDHRHENESRHHGDESHRRCREHTEAYDSQVSGAPDTHRTASCSPPASVYDLP